MKSIRRGVFETNSSSTHSISICSQKDYDAWQDGKMLWDSCKGKMITRDEAIAKIDDLDIKLKDDEEIEDLLAEQEIFTCNNYSRELEEFSHNHTTEGGEKIVAFGRYGYNG